MNIPIALAGIHQLAIETAPYIYYVENHPTYADKMDAVFDIVESQAITIMSSVITLTETLIKPLQMADQALINVYDQLFAENVRLIAISPEIARAAADLRARYRLRTPDALHVATAIHARCDALLTNDRNWKRVTELKILILDDLNLDPPKEGNS